MERLPTELVLQILGYMSQVELKTIGFISSEYRSLVVLFLIPPYLSMAVGTDKPGRFRSNSVLTEQPQDLPRRQSARCAGNKTIPATTRGTPTNNGGYCVVGGSHPTCRRSYPS